MSHYHIKKLLALGLVREEQGGYVVDRVVSENKVRIRKISIPVQTACATFFGATLFVMLVFLRPPSINSAYFLGVIAIIIALGVSLYEMTKTLRHP